MKFRLVWAELFHADRRTDKREHDNRPFPQSGESAQQTRQFMPTDVSTVRIGRAKVRSQYRSVCLLIFWGRKFVTKVQNLVKIDVLLNGDSRLK